MESRLLPFGTDGVRGPAEEVQQQALGIGEAVGTTMLQPGDLVLVGGDTRESSMPIAKEVAEGLLGHGVNVERVGCITTPGLAHAARNSEASAAVMITASHNPPGDNGIKIFTGQGLKLSDAQQDAITKARASTDISPSPGKRGRRHASYPSPIDNYVQFLMEAADGDRFGDMRIGLDMANGAGFYIGRSVFEKIGTGIVAIGCEPNGRNINVGCGATELGALQRLVAENNLDMGIALDGDGDRIMAVDEYGRVVDGDRMLHLLAVSGIYKNIKGVVGTVMTNIGLERSLKDRGIDLHRTKVGDRYVFEGMQAKGYVLGGESSGHIIQSNILPTGDGLLAGIRLIRAVRESGMTLGQWYDDVKMAPEASIKLRLPPSLAQAVVGSERVQELIQAERDTLGEDGLIIVRPSGTELGVVRVNVQAMSSGEAASASASRIAGALSEAAA